LEEVDARPIDVELGEANRMAADSSGVNEPPLGDRRMKRRIQSWASQVSRPSTYSDDQQASRLHSLAAKARQEKNDDLQTADQGTVTFRLSIWRRSFKLIERRRDKLSAAHARLRPPEH
jgi:hypothetical protein